MGELYLLRPLFTALGLTFNASEDEILSWAKRKADHCRRLSTAPFELDIETYCEKAGIVPPTPRHGNAGVVARMRSEQWWRRQGRTTIARCAEAAEIDLGLVHCRAGRYASDDAIERRRKKKLRDRALLEILEATNELDERFTLSELHDLSVANPALRRAELMTRIAGFEILSKKRGDVGEFYTITCPSRMHARLGGLGLPNNRYDHTTPKEAQKYLCKLWSQIRSALHRRHINPFGFRIVEPHHDGTPHWHLLLFMPPKTVTTVREMFKRYALKVDPDESGAQEHRFKAVRIDPSKGSAAGYVAKYIAKNIDGKTFPTNFDSDDPQKLAERVDAWARTWGIRQFQQFGGPPVGIWRQLRRHDGDLSGNLEAARDAARDAADQGDWAAFIEAWEQSIEAGKPLRLVKVWDDRPGEYGEPVGERVIGVTDGEVYAINTIHSWRISRKSDSGCSPPLEYCQ